MIEATLPIVGAHIGRISELFYDKLFAAAPSLRTDLFNRTNQENREQQKALASSVAAFATLLVTEDAADIDAIMARIAAKHASLGVQAPHYEVVRHQLFAAIAEVLGDAVTPEVAAAWREVYTLMANSLIEQEAALYDKAGVRPGQIWRVVVVSDVQFDGAEVATLTLRSPDGTPLPDFLPGQYISVATTLGDGTRQIRQYTLVRSHVPGEWAVTVKRVRGGIVSPFLAGGVGIGTELVVSHPFGSLVVEDGDDPLVLISAGIGITPTLAALQHLAAHRSEREVLVVHVDRSPYDHARRAETQALVDRLPRAHMQTRYSEFEELREDGHSPLDGVELPADPQVYVCGPVPFMRSIRQTLLAAGVSPDAVHYEAFAPGSWLGLEES